MKFIVEIDCDNQAYEDFNNEISFNLERIAEKVRDYENSGSVFDSNGNKVGKFYIEEE